ncbi:MAG: universal stress protein [Gammaproteobacteria bacterium]|jgi:nucleotide-binding universal stress UspA family protein|nr:universal stress protein [Gammaproteobacteria bacterium]
MNSPRNLVIAIDGSEPSLEALDEARDLAKAMGRELSALYVYPHHRGISATPAGLDEQTSKENLERMKEDESRRIFGEAESRLGARFAHRYVLTGDPAEEIIAFMEDNAGTHLVMGRRGLSKIKSLLMGSVSSKVAAHAPGLVTIV